MTDQQSFADDLSEQISTLIAEKLATRGGGMMTGWIAWVECVSSDGRTNFAFTCPPEQRVSHTAGLVSALRVESDLQLQEAFRPT